MSKIEQFKDREIEGKLKAWIAKGIQFSHLEFCNVKPLRFTHFKGSRTIKMEYSIGFGAGEEIKNIEFKEDLLDAKLKSYIARKITEGETNLDFIKPKKTKNFLEMSETTDNNIKGLQKSLFNAIKKLEDGTFSCEQAKAISSLSQTIINSAKLEIEYKRLLSDTPSVPLLD